MEEARPLSDIPSSYPVENHEQVIFQVVDSKGTSKFSVLNLAPTLDWSDLLVSIINMSANSCQHVVANAITCAIRSVNASSKCAPTDAFSLGEIRADSDLCFFRFFSQSTIPSKGMLADLSLLPATFATRANELIQEAFFRAESDVNWVERKAKCFAQRHNVGFSELTKESAKTLFAESLPNVSRGYIRHVIIKLHSPVSSEKLTLHAAHNWLADNLTLRNWFSLIHHDVVLTEWRKMTPKARNIRSFRLIDSPVSLDKWFDSDSFFRIFLVLLAGLARDSQGVPLREVELSLPFFSRWVDKKLKFFLSSWKLKATLELVRFGSPNGVSKELITVKGTQLFREALSEEDIFLATLLKEIKDLEGPSGPTTFMDFTNWFSANASFFDISFKEKQIPLLPIRELELWAVRFILGHPHVRAAFKNGIHHMAARAIDKALAVIDLRRGLACTRSLGQKQTQSFTEGVILHPSHQNLQAKFVKMPKLNLIKRSVVKFVVKVNMLASETDLSTNLANPLSLLSHQLQDMISALREEDFEADSPEFFEAATDIFIARSRLQKLLTKFILQANAEDLATARNASEMSEVIPSTWLFEDTWDKLKWAQSSSHTTINNTLWKTKLSNINYDDGLFTPSGFGLVFQSALGRWLWTLCKDNDDFEANEMEYSRLVVRLSLKFLVREGYSDIESQMSLFSDMLPLFWVPDFTPDILYHDIPQPNLLYNSQGGFSRKILHVHIMVKPQVMGVDRVPEFFPIFQGSLGFLDADFKLDDRELKFFDVPNRSNALLALPLFDTEDNSDFYKRSLLLRILASEQYAEDKLFFVNKRGVRKVMKLDFKSRVALAARLLKKRNIHLCVSFDTAEGAAHIFQANNMVATGLAFGSQAVSFTMLVPAPVSVHNVKLASNLFWQKEERPFLGCTWENLESTFKKASQVFPRFVSLIVYSKKHDRCFEAKIPLMMNTIVQNLWGWSEASVKLDIANEEEDMILEISPQGGDTPLPRRSDIAFLEHDRMKLDLEIDEISPEVLLSSDRHCVTLDESGLDRHGQKLAHPSSFRSKCLHPARQGIPFLIREEEGYNFTSNPSDFLIDSSGYEKIFVASLDRFGKPRRSIFANLANALDLETDISHPFTYPFQEHGSPLVGLWNYLFRVLQDVESDVIPVSAVCDFNRLLGAAPKIRENLVSVDWDKARDSVISELAARKARSLEALYVKLDPVKRALLHRVFFLEHTYNVPIHCLSFPGFLERASWKCLSIKGRKRSYLVSDFLKSCMKTTVQLDTIANQAVAVGHLPKVAFSGKEREAMAVMDHDLSTIKTLLPDDTGDLFSWIQAPEKTSNTVPWFLMADELQFVIKNDQVESEPHHLVKVIKLPFAEMLFPTNPQRIQAMVTGRRFMFFKKKKKKRE